MKKSNMSKGFQVKSQLRCMADGGDIISRGNQHMDDAIEAMSRGDAPPPPESTVDLHPVNPSLAGGFPTDKTPVLDRIFETMIKLGMRGGGSVKGPGGPKDDKIPAMLSNGEYVLPADTVKAVGKSSLDQLRYATHKFADGGVAMYEPPGEEPYPQGWSGDPRLRFMVDGGLAENWTGDPRLRFMAHGGTAYPGLEGIDVEEIPTQTLRSTVDPYPGPEGLDVRELPNRATADLDSTIGERARAAKAARAAAPAVEAAAPAAESAATAGSRLSRLRAAIPSVSGLGGKLAGAAGRAAAPVAAAYGAYQGLTDADPSETLGVAPATTDQGRTLQKLGNAGAGALSTLTLGAFSPADLANAAQGKEYNPPVERQGWATRLMTGLTGANDRVTPLLNPTVNDVAGTGGLRSRAAPAAPGAPSVGSEATPVGTAVINGRVVSPEEIRRLENRNVVSAENMMRPGVGTLGRDIDWGGAGSRGTDRDEGGVFHMPTRDPRDEINERFDALEKKIGPIGRSAARLRALSGLGEARARALEGIYGTEAQKDIADKQLQATIAQRAFDRRLDLAKFGVEEGRLNRQLAHDQAMFGLDQAKFRNEMRQSIYGQQLPNLYKGLDGFKSLVNDKGEFTPDGQRRAATLTRMIQASVPDVADLPPSTLSEIVKIADHAKDLNDAQDGIGAYLKATVLGGQRGKSDQLSAAVPTGTQRGALFDTVEDALGRRQTKQSYLRGSLNPLVAPDYDRARLLDEE